MVNRPRLVMEVAWVGRLVFVGMVPIQVRRVGLDLISSIDAQAAAGLAPRQLCAAWP